MCMHGCQGERRRQRITGLTSHNFPFQSSSYALFPLELSEQWHIVKTGQKLKTERFQVVYGQLCGSQNKSLEARTLPLEICELEARPPWSATARRTPSWREHGLGHEMEHEILHLSATYMTKLKPKLLSWCLGWLYRHVLNTLSNFRLI